MNILERDPSPNIPLRVPDDSVNKRAHRLLVWCPLVATTAQVVPCAFLIALRGYRVVIGGLAIFSASIAGPFEVFHQNAIRIPFSLIAGGLSFLNLYMYYYAQRRRQMPSARWRMQKLSAREVRTQRIQLYSSLLTLGMIAADPANHWIHGLS